MKVKLIIISIILLLVIVFASGCIPVLEKLGLVNPTNEEQLSPEKGGPPDGLVKVLIGFKEKPGPAQQAIVKGVGGKIKYTYNIVDAIAASIPEKAIDALQKNPNVTNVELDIKVYALKTELESSWGVEHIGAGIVHVDGNSGKGVNIAIIDSGIDYTHLDLEANYAGGYDFVNKDTDPMDDNGHGTHVAGTVAAESDGDGVVGVAPEASLYALKVLNSSGSGDYSDVIAALQWCVDNNIQVTNNSYGSSGDPGETVKTAFDNAYYDYGIIHVAAAGNSGNPPGRGDNIIYPARYESVIAVAATDQNDKRASWSSTGPDVELSAPGVAINSTLLGGGYGEKSGTSMASPHVAGAVALVWVANPGWSNDIVRTQLQSTADDLGDSGRDSLYGYGLVDADEAAGVENDPPTVSITDPAGGSTFDSGATILFKGTAIDSEDGDLAASLVWTSNIDGQIGTGGSFSTTLSDGTHTITAKVTDSGGKNGSASIGITVGTIITNNMYVSDIYMSLKISGPWVNAIAKISIVDENGTPVEGATVSGTWSGATDDTNSGITKTNGQVNFKSDRVKNPPSGIIFTFTADDVAKAGWGYNSTANAETSDSTTVP